MIVPSQSGRYCTWVDSLIPLRMRAAHGREARFSRPVVRKRLRPTQHPWNCIGCSDGRCGTGVPGGHPAVGTWRWRLAG